MIVFGTFVLLVVLTVSSKKSQKEMLTRTRSEWVVDCVGLFIQGVAIPALQIVMSTHVFIMIFPSLHQSLSLAPWAAFLLNFVGVDYLYYWNHRLLHTQPLWPLHRVHHGATQFDVLITSRNALWTPIFIVYLWVNGFFIFLLSDPTYFILGASVSAALDLWRHTRFSLPAAIKPIFSPFFILPEDHAAHHGREIVDVNFGANFKLWDKLHGTHMKTQANETATGFPVSESWQDQLLNPWKEKAS